MSPLKPDAHIGLLAAYDEREADGIRDYSLRLLDALRDQGMGATLYRWVGDGWHRPSGAPRLDELDAVIVQYNPFMFGRRGFAPRLPLALAGLRRRPRRPLLAVMFHETYVEMKNVKWALMGGWQRAQLLAVQATADVQLCTIERWTERLRRTARGRPVHHLPVPSNVPDVRDQRSEGRRELGVDDDTLVLACLGLRHPGRLEGHMIEAARRSGSRGKRVLLLNLGPGARGEESLGPNVVLCNTGFLDQPHLARALAGSDVFLAAYQDGVSTRRTTVMGALQQAVPVVGTAGHLTDTSLRSGGGVTLVPVADRFGFADAVADLAGDPERRRQRGQDGHALYTSRFDWPVLVRRLRDYLHA